MAGPEGKNLRLDPKFKPESDQSFLAEVGSSVMSAMDEQTWEGNQEYSLNGVNRTMRKPEKLRELKGHMCDDSGAE